MFLSFQIYLHFSLIRTKETLSVLVCLDIEQDLTKSGTPHTGVL